MIEQNILYLPIDDQFTVGLNCTVQTLAMYEHNKMKAEVGLSPLQTIIMQLFLKQFPYFVPDKVLVEAVYGRQRVDNQLKKNVSRVLTQLRSRIEPLDLKIKRINQTGYLLGLIVAKKKIGCIFGGKPSHIQVFMWYYTKPVAPHQSNSRSLPEQAGASGQVVPYRTTRI